MVSGGQRAKVGFTAASCFLVTSELRNVKADCDGRWAECVNVCEAAAGLDYVVHSMHFSQV